MKFLTFAIILFLFAGFAPGFAQEGDYDLESVKTTNGTRYLDILILDADDHGLTFRHRDGIAKVPYYRLSMNLRMLYEPVEEVAEAGDVEAEEGEEADPSVVESEVPEFVHMQAVSRISAPVSWLRGAFTQMPRPPMACWPSHWPRYHPAHALAYPAYRELAVRDFLYTTGLAGRPYGVHPCAIPRHGTYRFY